MLHSFLSFVHHCSYPWRRISKFVAIDHYCVLCIFWHSSMDIYKLYNAWLTSTFKIHSNKWWWVTWSQQSALQVLVHISSWVSIHVYMGMFKECRVDTYTSIVFTSETTALTLLPCTALTLLHSTDLQPLTTAVVPSYCCSILTCAIANNVVISSIPWGVSVCECGVGDKAVVGKEYV